MKSFVLALHCITHNQHLIVGVNSGKSLGILLDQSPEDFWARYGENLFYAEVVDLVRTDKIMNSAAKILPVYSGHVIDWSKDKKELIS